MIYFMASFILWFYQAPIFWWFGFLIILILETW